MQKVAITIMMMMNFFVLADGEEVPFEESATKTHRSLTIVLPADTEEIEIIGTFVIPEFGSIAMLVLAVAVVSIISLCQVQNRSNS